MANIGRIHDVQCSKRASSSTNINDEIEVLADPLDYAASVALSCVSINHDPLLYTSRLDVICHIVLYDPQFMKGKNSNNE